MTFNSASKTALMKRTLVARLWLACLLPASNALADVVTLKDGHQISGVVEFGISSQIRIRIGEKSQMVPVDQILSIQFDPQEGSAPPSTAAVSTVLPSTPPPPAAAPSAPAPTSTAPASAPQGITLPIGTEIAVRTVEPIDSKKADLYKEYAATLDDPVVVDGVTLVPVNANAILRVSHVQASGVTRRASLSISLIAITANGRRVDVKTGPVDSKSGSQAKRTATGAAVGAATGAAVGAMAGGAVGAGIGAGVGAAAGTAVAVVKGKPVEIKSETRFTYTLTEPVVISPESRR
jgi:hypothetical protein